MWMLKAYMDGLHKKACNNGQTDVVKWDLFKEFSYIVLQCYLAFLKT